MGLFRSERMECYEVVIPKSVLYGCLASLGELEVLEIISTNLGYEIKPYHEEVKILDDLKKKLKIIVKGVKFMKLVPDTPKPIPLAPHPSELLNLGSNKRTSLNTFYKLYEEYQEISERCDYMNKKLIKLTEKHESMLFAHKYILDAKKYFEKKALKSDIERASVPFDSRFFVLAAVMPSVRTKTIEVLIWRLTSGNAMVSFLPIERKRKEGRDVGESKCIVLVSVQGIILAELIKKLLNGYRIPLFNISLKDYERKFFLNRTVEEIVELRGLLNETNGHRRLLLISAAKSCKKWFIEIEKMKTIYTTMNNIDGETLSNNFLLTFWVPQSKTEDAFRALMGVCQKEGLHSPYFQKVTNYDHSPPTYIRVNKFTEAFQHIVDAYGIPSYRELNPMPYTVITFPFLFAVMFGDMGHGLIMTVFATTLIIFEKRIDKAGLVNEMAVIIYKGRYIILLMGLFSIFTGTIYNEFFSIGLFLPYSHWTLANYHLNDITYRPSIKLNPTDDFYGIPFVFGLDPIWNISENEIVFINAIKMKVAIILGVTQMLFGIVLNLFNHIFFKNYIAIFTEFIPQIIFFLSIFGYLIFLFFFKWFTFSAQGIDALSPGCAPSLLITFINMMMFRYEPNVGQGCYPDMYVNQKLVQQLLLFLGLSMVPILLFVDPIIEIVKLKRNKNKQVVYVENEGVVSIIVHQFIHVIEFVLGSVSYTASYLRLWALSLAHSLLSSVLWKMVFTVPTSNIFLGVLIASISFTIFAIFTLGILVIIEGLSAFLHALRLHWMEFQSKFYIGLGHHYSPFSFRPILQQAKIYVKKRY